MSEFSVANVTTTSTTAPADRASISVAGRERTFTVVGAKDSPRRRDLVLIFHGSKQTGDAHRAFTGRSFDAMTEGDGAVVVYLDGYRGNWNDARKESFFPARLENIDDVAFARAVIAQLERSHGIDPTRVFAIGYSNGGQMVMRLVHEIGDQLAGAAIFSATMPSPDSFLAPSPAVGTVAVPILLIHGTKDPIVPFAGGTMSGWARRLFKVGGTTLSMEDTAEYFARRNGITATPKITSGARSAAAKTWADETDYVQAGHPSVRLLTVHGGGHTIPGPRKGPFILGRTNQNVSAAAVAAEFLGIGANS